MNDALSHTLTVLPTVPSYYHDVSDQLQEVAQRKRYNLSVDVFSFAILLWEMCALEKPFKNFTELQHTNLVVEKGHRPKLDCLKSWPAGVKDVIVKCWAQDFYARPTFAEIVQLLETLMSDFPLLEKAPSKDG